jgi:hypothetical protein
MPEKNVLFLVDERDAAEEGWENADRVIAMREELLKARKQRKQPLLDTKILTSWNALMIRALAFAGKELQEPRYSKAAGAAADFLLERHADGAGGLMRTSRGAAAKYAGFLDDYAFLIQALLAIGDETRRADAQRLAGVMKERFADSDGGGFYFTDTRSSELIVRQKVGSDSPLPSGNAIAATVLLELGDAEGGRNVLSSFAEAMNSSGEGMSSMVQAAAQYVRLEGEIRASAGGVPRSRSPEDAGHVVSLRAAWDGPSSIRLKISIRDGFHIGSNDAAPQIVDTRVSVSSGLAEIEYPPAQSVVFPFAEDELSVYLGEIEIGVKFGELPAGAVRLTVRYQACNDRACLAIASRTIEVPKAG